jgi:Concanavalin A-like lectin/glucanases superfamily
MALLLPMITACIHAGGGGNIPKATVWNLDNLTAVDGHALTLLGSPRLLSDGEHRALCFDGKADGIFLDVNPLEGWDQFTVEILFRPDGDGPAEQRFVHIQDDQERRVLIETRVTPQRAWALDTFLRATDAEKLTLLDPALVQPTDRWYWAALTYDGKTMRHFVDTQQQLDGAVAFPPTGPGRISLGVRQNRVHWFKGCIAQVRFTRTALDRGSLQRP